MCGIIWGMLGSERLDRKLLDTMAVCGDLIPEGSVYRFLAEHRGRVFPDGMFEDLYGGRGRPSIPGSVVATVMVLQALEGLSDREAIGRLRCDIRWKAAAGLGLTDPGFHPTVLTLWRARLRRSEAPERIFDAVRKVVDQSGVLDSTVLDEEGVGFHGVGRRGGHRGHSDDDHSPDSQVSSFGSPSSWSGGVPRL